MQKTVEAWWFSNDKILPHGDGRRIRKGITHKIKGEVVPCKNGLHGSKKILDALTYAPGSIIWKVQLSGVVVAHNNDKLAASERTYLTNGVDTIETLREFSRKCALDVIHLWNAPDIIVQYLKTGNENLRDAARCAARDAAWAAARDVARCAARDAAWDAVRKKQNRRLTRMVNKLIKEK